MEQFTASNGIRVRIDAPYLDLNKGQGWGAVGGSAEAQALREFFQHERDEELGRWRYPGDPRYVVHGGYSPGEQRRFARVLNEQLGIASVVYEGAKERSEVSDIAAAFFEAHPARKPWEDAKEGEVWIITYQGNEYPSIFQAGQFRDHGGHWTPESITDARRIWPVSDD